MDIDNIIFTELQKAQAEISQITDESMLLAGSNRLVSAVKDVVSLSNIARKQGLLYLEEAATTSIDDEILKAAVLLIVDGTDPLAIMKILSFQYTTLQLHDFDIITYWINVVGALSIQAGDHPFIIEKMLKSMITAKARELYDAPGKENVSNPNSREFDLSIVTKHWEGIETYEEHNILTALATRLIYEMNDTSIQRLTREFDNTELALAMKILSPVFKKKIFTNMSAILSVMIAEEMECLGPVKVSSCEAAVKRILWTILKLEDSGEIYITSSLAQKVSTVLNNYSDIPAKDDSKAFIISEAEIDELLKSLTDNN